MPHIHGREFVIATNEVFDLNPFPSRLLIVGVGFIACEFAAIFNGLGSQVTQLYWGEQVLRGFMTKSGISPPRKCESREWICG